MKVCKECSKEFEKSQFTEHCSYECWIKRIEENTPVRICKECNKEFRHTQRTAFCSNQCQRDSINKKQRLKAQLRKQKALKAISPDDNTLSFFINRYKKGAEKRGHSFELTKEEFASYWKKDCYYCHSHIKTIGIDRYDSSIGYTNTNCVPCCSQCNSMKWDLNGDEFISKCKHISHKHLSPELSI